MIKNLNGKDFAFHHFIFLMSDKLAVLKDYPKDGPEVPEREKIVRTKDRHESGTGRRDKTKRQGKGAGNWGDPKDDVKYMDEVEPQEDYEEEEEAPEQKK